MSNQNPIKRKPILETFLFLTIAVLGVMYVSYTWIKFNNNKSDQVLQIARYIEAALPKEDLKALEAKPGDIDKPQYKVIKNTLKAIIRVNPQARFAYLYTEQNGKIYFIADSEPEDSEDYSPPGQEYTEVKSENKQPFRDGKELVTAPFSDRWGTWISTLVPIKDDATGKTIAVFGMDFNAKSWDNLLLFTVIKSSVLILLLLLAFLFLFKVQTKNRLLKNEIIVRKQTEEKHLESEERFSLLSRVTIEGIIIHENGIVKDLNAALLRLLGYEREELLNKNFMDFIYVDDIPIVLENIAKEHILLFEVRAVKKNGEIFFAELDARNIQYQGKVLRVAVIRDITKRKQAEKALYESETRMRSITDSAQDAILMMNPDGRVSYWNPAAERIFGYTSVEAIGQDLHSFIVPQHYHEAHLAAFPAFLKTGHGSIIGKTLDLEARRKDGTEISVQLSLSSIKINDAWHSVGILRDITGQKKTEAALLKAKQESEMANKAKSIFLSNMSHEIRTPLNAIIGFSQLMNRDKQLTDLQKEYNISIIRAGEHLLELINEILELSKIEAGRVELNPTNIDLHSFSDDIHMLFKERAQSKHLQLIFETADDLPQYVVIDENKLRQIFVNLIGNAIKFTDEGGIAVRIRGNKINEGTSHLIVEIEDSGPGISENELDKLFKHFEQTSSGIKKGSGTGLGLALSRELAILMGGNITVSSQVGKGSVFTFHVEIKEGKIESVEKSNTKRAICIDKKGEEVYRILVVDDKKENLQVAVNLLKLVGFETNEAVNGKDAIAKFEECNPHLILMDMRMPIMDGYEATRLIKSMEKGKQTPIIALTASTFEEERNKIESLNMQGYIRKPFRENELFSTIGKVLGIKYIYEDETPLSQAKYLNDDEEIAKNIAKLPNSLVLEMLDAISVADLDQLIKLINSIDPDNSMFAQHLMALAKNYDYDHLQQILNEKEKN